MYLHQVIDDLSKISYSDKLPEDSAGLAYALKGMKRSQSFHMGDIDDVDRILGNRNDLLFQDPTYLKLPYADCWFDWTFNAMKTKGGIYVHRITPTFWELFPSTFSDEIREWLPVLIPLVALIGGRGHATNEVEFRNYLKLRGWREPSIFQWNDYVFPVPTQQMWDYMGEKGIEDIFREEAIDCGVLHKSLLLLNCKNITTIDHEPSAKLNNARRKRGKQEGVTYKTLTINPMGKHSNPSSLIDMTEDHNRLHLCRGHLKEYTADAPLFGKHIGLWYWDSHVRGQNRDGIVIKEYQVVT